MPRDHELEHCLTAAKAIKFSLRDVGGVENPVILRLQMSSYAPGRGPFTSTQLRLQIQITIDLMPPSDPVPPLLRRFLEIIKSHTSFRGGVNHPTQLRLQI